MKGLAVQAQCHCYWWHVESLYLVVHFGFLPKILEGSGNLRMTFAIL